jgi:hypothetical protein
LKSAALVSHKGKTTELDIDDMVPSFN